MYLKNKEGTVFLKIGQLKMLLVERLKGKRASILELDFDGDIAEAWAKSGEEISRDEFVKVLILHVNEVNQIKRAVKKEPIKKMGEMKKTEKGN